MGNVRAAYAFGEDGSKLAALLDGKVEVTVYPKLRDATLAAAGEVTEGETVLLSPACASFDEFRDFEHRGDSFREIVAALRDGGS